MQYGKYTFTCRFETDAELPAYKGSTFRGVFGHALKRVVCALKRQECPDCILRERCLYTRVFETALSQGGQDAVRNSAIPHPFVIEPPPETKTHYVKSDMFECGLILFGERHDDVHRQRRVSRPVEVVVRIVLRRRSDHRALSDACRRDIGQEPLAGDIRLLFDP